MSVYQTTLLGRTTVADGTIAFRFEKPNDFALKAGQYVDLTISGPEPGPSGQMTRIFSIASSPLDEDLLVATRMRHTAFGQTLADLSIGSGARIDGPTGSFHLQNNTARPAVFLAGEIGIAPLLSMLSYATPEKIGHPMLLFHANRPSKDAAFIDVLWKLEHASPRFRSIPTLTRQADDSGAWKGKTGHISSEMLFTQVRVMRGLIYYIAGPHVMVAATSQTLGNAGVNEDDVRTEEFAGY